MRILHLANHCGKANGHVNVSVDMACIQAQGGHVVGYASSGGDFIELMKSYNVATYFVCEPHRSVKNFFDAIRQMRAVLRRFRPDVVHIHMAAQSVLMQPFRLLGYKTVTTVHNEFDRSVWLMGLADRIVTVSRSNALAMSNRGFRRAKIRTVLNGSLGSPRLPQSFNLAALNHPAILTVCGLHPRKGIADLLNAFQIVLQDHPAATLYLAGEGPSQPIYEKQAQDLGLGARAVFLGFQSDPRQFLYAADIFVLASHADPGPLVIAEARAAGCAIVASDVDGIPESLDYGAAGILVPPKQPEELAGAIKNLLKEPAELQKYRALAKQNIERFTVERVCREMEVIYHEVA